MGYVWGAKRDLRGGIKIPQVPELRLTVSAEKDWEDYEIKNIRSKMVYYEEELENGERIPAHEWRKSMSLSAIAGMVNRKQSTQRTGKR